MEFHTTLTTEQKNTNYCDHLIQADKVLKCKEYAEPSILDLDDLKKTMSDEDFAVLSTGCSDGKLLIWKLPENVYVVPSFCELSHETPLSYIHIRDKKCPLATCKEKKSKLHTLTKKDQPLCNHTLLIHHSTGQHESPTTKREFFPKLNRDQTTKIVMDNILSHFPSMTSMDSTGFVHTSRRFVEKLVSKKRKHRDQAIREQTKTTCTFCPDVLLEDWPFSAKQGFLLSLGHMVKIKILLKFCRRCKVLFYPGKFSKNKPNKNVMGMRV